MLNDQVLLAHIKGNLGYPFNEIELLDKDILYYSKEIVLKKYFSPFYPAIKFHLLDTSKDEVKTEYENRFKIISDDGSGIIRIIDVLRNFIPQFFFGSVDFYGTLTYSSMPDWAMRSVQSQTTSQSSALAMTHQLIYPNYLEIRPATFIVNNAKLLVIYEAEHVDFSTVPTYAENKLMDLCLAYIKRIIGQIRGKYSELTTVFGNININYSELKSEGQELWDRIMEDMKNLPPLEMIEIF